MTDTTNRYVSRGAEAHTIDVKCIEAKATYGGGLMAKPLIMGELMTFLEITYIMGSGAPLHVHEHGPLVYVVRGRIESTIDGEDYKLEPGGTCLHSAGVPNTVEALEDATLVEIKSPAHNIAKFLEW